MARVEVPKTIINSSTGLPINGASVAISFRSSGAPATWYTGETGGTASTAAVITDALGRVNAWVDRGAYNLTISGTGITTYTEAWDAAPGGDGTVDPAWVSSTVVIPGEIKMYGGTGVPTGWLFCGGGIVSRSTYPALFSVIGTAYGAGDGVSTFQLPDLRGRSPLGHGTGTGLTARTVGQTGGVQQVTLTAAESGLPDHSHSMVSGNAGGAPFATGDAGGGKTGILGITAGGSVFGIGGATGGFFNIISVGNVFGGAKAATQDHENMHPFQVVSFIIKT